MQTSLGVCNVSFGVWPPGPRGAQLRLPPPLRRGRPRPGDRQPRPHHALRGDQLTSERELADDLVFNRRERRARALHRPLRGQRAGAGADDRPTPTTGMAPERRSTPRSCAGARRASRRGSTRRREDRRRSPSLNEVLLPAMKEVGDKFGAGELILPFVLQCAEVMKRAVAQLEQYLDSIEGYTKGTVVLATVFGDVHDIGKIARQHDPHATTATPSSTSASRSRSTTIVDAGRRARRDRDRPLRPARLAPRKQMPACVERAARQRPRVPGARSAAPRSTATSAAASSTRTAGVRRVYEPGVFYCKDAFEGLAIWTS